MSQVGIIIPTFNNPDYLYPCVDSLINYTVPDDLFHIYIVNNGLPEHMERFKDNPYITVLQQKENMGWEGGLKAGLAASKEPYVLLLNDDTQILSHQRLWLNMLLQAMVSQNCAAVGPSSNFVMGNQYALLPLRESVYRSKFLIGFCMLVRRSDLDAAGGIDDTLPGGDDLDLSIRLRALGKYLLINREVFVWHHGARTGGKVRSDWNSVEMTEKTNHALIRKHGLKPFLDLWAKEDTPKIPYKKEDVEAETIKKHSVGKILELGCGDKKLFPDSFGVDIVPKGVQIDGLAKGRVSVADAVADVSKELPVDPEHFDTVIASHVLEHCIDPVATLTLWKSALKPGGRLIIAVPNQAIRNTIIMNHQHVHAYTPESLTRLMESLGWKMLIVESPGNFISFVGVYQK